MNTFASNNRVGMKHKDSCLKALASSLEQEEDGGERAPEGRPSWVGPRAPAPHPPGHPGPGAPDKLNQRPRASGSEVGIRGWSSSQILREELSKVGTTEGDLKICLNPPSDSQNPDLHVYGPRSEEAGK